MSETYNKKHRYGSVSIKGVKADFDYYDPEQAMPIVKAAAFLQPHDADNWCILGDLCVEEGDCVLAIDSYEMALKIKPESGRALSGKEKAEVKLVSFPYSYMDPNY